MRARLGLRGSPRLCQHCDRGKKTHQGMRPLFWIINIINLFSSVWFGLFQKWLNWGIAVQLYDGISGRLSGIWVNFRQVNDQWYELTNLLTVLCLMFLPASIFHLTSVMSFACPPCSCNKIKPFLFADMDDVPQSWSASLCNSSLVRVLLFPQTSMFTWS